MPDSISIQVCVAALTNDDLADLQNLAFLELLQDAQENYNVLEQDIVYGETPEEWRPFDDNKTIIDYLEEANFQATFERDCLQNPDDPAILNAIFKVQLFIFDPLFLSLDKYAGLINKIVGAIRQGDIHFCVLVPNRTPPELRQKLKEFCDQKLNDLKYTFDKKGSGEWGSAAVDERLKSYLNRINPEIRQALPPGKLDEAKEELTRGGAQATALGGSPKIV